MNLLIIRWWLHSQRNKGWRRLNKNFTNGVFWGIIFNEDFLIAHRFNGFDESFLMINDKEKMEYEVLSDQFEQVRNHSCSSVLSHRCVSQRNQKKWQVNALMQQQKNDSELSDYSFSTKIWIVFKRYPITNKSVEFFQSTSIRAFTQISSLKYKKFLR